MIFKYEAVISLDKKNQDIGVANSIFMKVHQKKNGYNTETQEKTRQEIMDVKTIEQYSTWKNKEERITRIIKG